MLSARQFTCSCNSNITQQRYYQPVQSLTRETYANISIFSYCYTGRNTVLKRTKLKSAPKQICILFKIYYSNPTKCTQVQDAIEQDDHSLLCMKQKPTDRGLLYRKLHHSIILICMVN